LWDHYIQQRSSPDSDRGCSFFSYVLCNTMYVYILYSEKLDRFYVGQTALPPEQRLEEHNSARNENSFTTTRPKNE